MLTQKQEILTRLTASYINGFHLIPAIDSPVAQSLKAISEDILSFGADEVRRTTVLSPDTLLRDLNLGVRATQCLEYVAKQAGLAEDRDQASGLPVAALFPHLFEEDIIGLKNVGETTIREIKQKFALCGHSVPLRAPVVAKPVD